MFGQDNRLRRSRREMLKAVFDAQVLDFTEDNLPTQIATFFEDMLSALPESARECNIEGLLANALQDWR